MVAHLSALLNPPDCCNTLAAQRPNEWKLIFRSSRIAYYINLNGYLMVYVRRFLFGCSCWLSRRRVYYPCAQHRSDFIAVQLPAHVHRTDTAVGTLIRFDVMNFGPQGLFTGGWVASTSPRLRQAFKNRSFNQFIIVNERVHSIFFKV